MSDVSYDMRTVTAPRRTRRLSDKILIAFHQACDHADLQVAERLLNVVDTMTAAPRFARRAPRGSERRRDQETLVAAHERLWQLRHPDTAGKG